MQPPFGPSIGIFEFSSISNGYFCMDQILKKAPVKILEGSPMTPGKFFVLFNGDEASVEESFEDIKSTSKGYIIDSVRIPQLEKSVLPALYGLIHQDVKGALAIIEATSMASGLLAADQSVKMADVKIIEIRSSRGIGGKCFFFVTGAQSDVEAAAETSSKVLSSRGHLVNIEVIANPDNEFLSHFNVSGEV